MSHAVTAVEIREDYVLSVVFGNGENGLLDMKPYLDFGVFKEIQNLSVFNTARVSFDTIAWESGTDLDPEFVYEKCRIVRQGTPADG